MEMIFRNIPLARSGHSDKRGDLSTGMLCMIPAHSYSKLAQVHYKNTIIGVVKNLTFADLHNGVAELRGDIVFGCNYSTIAEMAFDEVYPSISVFTTLNNKDGANPYLDRLSLVCKDEREFEDQQPLDLSELRNLINSATKSEAPESAVIFNKKYDNEKTGLIGSVHTSEEKTSNYYDIKENNTAITFDNEGEDVGNGIMRYGHYCNGALMGYIVCGVTEFGGDHRPRHPLDILEKFVEHQRKKNN
ncbi:hypothetical protein AHX81_001251 [Salmonella enterica subsp. enterica]|nr:hypothetical protein [Salmonella enterica subsp. enterica]